ncbi:phage integrase SAM-like domain-containing protein [Labilibaculum euxinus]
MSTINTFGNILHIRKDKLNKKGEAPIYLRVTINGKRAAIACKQFVLPGKWSSEAGKIKGTKEDIKVINDHLAKLKTKVNNIYQKLVENNNPISAAIVKEIFLGNQVPGKTLVQAFIIHNQMIEERVGIDYAEATHRRYVTTLMHTKNFLSSQYNKEDILLCDLNYEFIENFEHYFKTVRKCCFDP